MPSWAIFSEKHCTTRGAMIATQAKTVGIDSVMFLSWSHGLVRNVSELTYKRRKVLLIDDAYRAHIFIDVLELFYKMKVIPYELPWHVSGKMQDLDAVVFSSS